MKKILSRLVALTVVGTTAVCAQIPFAKVYEDVGIDQKLNAQLPLDAVFRDEQGDSVRLAQYFGSMPVVLSLVYYQCPMLCTQVLNGMVDGFKGLGLRPGRDFQVVTVSIDPTETPALARDKKEGYLAAYGQPDAARGWHFLTGDEPSIERLAASVGFRYLYDAKNKQYAHAAGIMIATPAGRVSHYLLGIEYSPKDLRFALMDASQGRIGSVVDKLVLLCYHYDPTTGKYSLVIANIFRGAGAVTLIGLGGYVFFLHRRSKRKRMKTADGIREPEA